MAEEKIGIFRAMMRFLRMWNWKKARGIINAADRQFTGSTEGISAAFDIQQDKMVSQYQGLRDAISEVESILEDKRQRLEDLNLEEDDLIKKREGALAMAENAHAESNTAEYDKHSRAFERFQGRIDEIDETQGRLNIEVEETSATMDKYMLQLQDFQSEIGKMPQQKAEAMADFVSAKSIVELNDRLQGLETSMDRGPISAVLDANKKLTAKARISSKLSGADVKLQDKQYEQAGRQSTSRSKMDEMLAARKLERDQKDGKVAEKVETEENRPKI